MCLVAFGKMLSWNQMPLYTVFQDNRQIKAKCHNKTKNVLHVRRRILPIAFDKRCVPVLGNIVLFAFDCMYKYCCLLLGWSGIGYVFSGFCFRHLLCVCFARAHLVNCPYMNTSDRALCVCARVSTALSTSIE